jgi:hypothetical protein
MTIPRPAVMQEPDDLRSKLTTLVTLLNHTCLLHCCPSS